MQAPPEDAIDRHWWRWLLLLWGVAAFLLIAWKWSAIHWFALGDTDDNLRFAQVRAWIEGQGWYDLRQYRLDPPGGANIHWSRLVDLPIAGLWLGLKPFVGQVLAQKWAVAIAPLLALGGLMVALSLAVRRLVAPAAFPFAILILGCAQTLLAMYMPLRIDHHGWQLATLALAVAAIADPRQARGGVTLGLATAASLSIGLELLPYFAVAAGITGLRWVIDREQALRLRAYGVALAAGCGAGFLLFASQANRLAVCDALSPVWLSAVLFGGGLLVALSLAPVAGWRVRLALAILAIAAIGGAFALTWPHCLSRPEGVSPELYDIWLKNVREAKPVYVQSWRTAVQLLAMPVAGLIGCALALVRARGTDRFWPWAGVTLLLLTGIGLLLWQMRAGPATQLLGLPGATALAWMLVRPLARSRDVALRLSGPILALLAVSGAGAKIVIDAVPGDPPSKTRKAINRANTRCPTLPVLRPISKLPPATILTFVDFGPRLIAVTHHSAIAGPYHRNGAAILDVQHAFRGSVENARAIIRRHGVTMVLICPGMSESTIYASESRNGFYAQLQRGQVPGWLEPVPLPKSSPLKLWRVAP